MSLAPITDASGVKVTSFNYYKDGVLITSTQIPRLAYVMLGYQAQGDYGKLMMFTHSHGNACLTPITSKTGRFIYLPQYAGKWYNGREWHG